MISWIIAIGIGAAAGAALGYFGQCSSGACPLTANWKRGSLYGAFMGLLFYSVWGAGGNSGQVNASTENIQRISQAEFDAEVTRASGPVLVDFYAPWCGPCKRLSPMLEEIAGSLAGEVKFVKVNVDNAPELARRFEVQGVPTLLFFRDGQVVDRLVGLPDAGSLKQRLATFAAGRAAVKARNNLSDKRELPEI